MKIKNTLDTLNIASGSDLIFEPLETKDLPVGLATTILRLGDGFECVDSTKQNLTCECGFKAKTLAGLKAHKRKC